MKINKTYIIYTLIFVVIIHILPEEKVDILFYVAVAYACFYIYHKEKTQEFAKRFEIWLKNSENIKQHSFENFFDKKYCDIYHQLNDPRANKEQKDVLQKEWKKILIERKNNGLPEHCEEYRKLCIYPKTYF